MHATATVPLLEGRLGLGKASMFSRSVFLRSYSYDMEKDEKTCISALNDFGLRFW